MERSIFDVSQEITDEEVAEERKKIDMAHLSFTVCEVINTVWVMCLQADLTPSQVRILVTERYMIQGPMTSVSYDFTWRDIAVNKLFRDITIAIQDY